MLGTRFIYTVDRGNSTHRGEIRATENGTPMLERATENGTPMLEGADRARAGEIRGLRLA